MRKNWETITVLPLEKARGSGKSGWGDEVKDSKRQKTEGKTLPKKLP